MREVPEKTPARIPSQVCTVYEKDTMYDFVGGLLSKVGLAVMTVNINNNQQMMLQDKCENETTKEFQLLNNILSESHLIEKDGVLDDVIGHYKEFVALLTTPQDKAIILCLLTQLCFTTKNQYNVQYP